MSMIDNILIEALSRQNIEIPQKTIISNGFIRWGKENKYYAKEITNGWVYGDFTREDLKGVCFNNEGKTLTSEEKALHKHRAEQERARINEEQEKLHIEACKNARELINLSTAATNDHQYLQRKKILSYGLRLLQTKLLIPLYDINKQLSSIQFIDESGKKIFLSGGKKRGCYFPIGKPNNKIYICEGYATGATIHKVTGDAVAIAFDAGNLKPVAVVMKQKYPNLEIVIAGDNDQWKDKNSGLIHAQQAAECIGAKIAIPCFDGLDITNKPTDFNDLACLAGIDVVKSQLERAFMSKEPTSTNFSEANELIPHQSDNTAPVKDHFEETLTRLVQLSPTEYEQCRKKEAKALNMRVTFLDDLVRTQHTQPTKNTIGFDHELENGIEAWPEPVDGYKLAEEIKEIFRQYLVLNIHQIIALVLWSFGSYCLDAFFIFPKLLITSPILRCGKTTLMRVLNCILHRTLMASNISAAAIFRAVDLWEPSLLIDEGDTFINNNEEMRGIINSGHTKDTAYVLRVEGDSNNRTPKRFSTWAPMVIAMIQLPSETILDRSVVINLRRKSEKESVNKLNIDSFSQLKPLRQKLKRWANDNIEALKNMRPQMPLSGSDRATDNWLPLFAIATLLGPNWINKATVALENLTLTYNEENVAATLLHDIRDIFEFDTLTRISSDDLTEKLKSIEDHPWIEYRNGQPITKNTLAKLLRPFGIKPKQLWINGQNKSGYVLSDFEETFLRYIPPTQTPRILDSNTDETYKANQNPRLEISLGLQNASKPNADADPRSLGFQKENIVQNNDQVKEVFIL